MKRIVGELTLPGDKSISHRAALFSSFADIISTFENFNFNRDCKATLDILGNLGIKWGLENESLIIEGKPIADWQKPKNYLNAQNSGTTSRLMSGILANLDFETKITGDESLSRRPMKRVLDPLHAMGAKFESADNRLPITFYPVEKLNGICYRLPMASAQVKSAILLAGLFAEGQTEVIEDQPTRDHTERLLGLKKKEHSDSSVSIFNSRETQIPDISMKIPGDFSSAAFFISAAVLLPGSELVIRDVSLNPTRTGYLQILNKMGAEFKIEIIREKPEPLGDIYVRHIPLKNIEIPAALVPNIIDEIPVISVLALQSEGTFLLRNAAELRHKESDRINAMVLNLKSIGVEVHEFEDGLELTGPQKLGGGKIKTFGDHRIAMAFAVANLLTDETIEIDNPSCVNVSFPTFWEQLNQITE